MEITRALRISTTCLILLSAALVSFCLHAAVITNHLNDDSDGNEWRGFVDVSTDLVLEGGKSRTIDIDTAAEKIDDSGRWELSLEYKYSEEDFEADQFDGDTFTEAELDKFIKSSVVLEDNIEVESQYDIFFRDRSYIWLSQEMEADRVEDLKLGLVLGIGLGHQFATRGRLRKTQYEVEIGLAYNRMDFASGVEPDENFASPGDPDYSDRWGLISHEFLYKFKRGVVFKHEMTVVRYLTKPEGTVAEMENALAVSLGKNFFLRITHETAWSGFNFEEESTEQILTFSLGWES